MRAREWLAGAAPDLQVIEPTPIAPPAAGRNQEEAARIGLVDLILLGVRVDNSQPVAGKVRLVYFAKDPAEAKRIFAHLASDVHHAAGLEWRTRFIEGKSEFELGRYHISFDGPSVFLAVAIEDGVWARFNSR